jgi:hypothetical protein
MTQSKVNIAVPTHRFMDWDTWSQLLLQGLRGVVMRVEEKDWIEFANHVRQSTPLNQVMTPDPALMIDWRDWADKLAMATGAGL